MRFLIFNLVVVGALFYLFNGGMPGGSADGDDMLNRVSDAARSTVDAGRKATAEIVKQLESPPAAGKTVEEENVSSSLPRPSSEARAKDQAAVVKTPALPTAPVPAVPRIPVSTAPIDAVEEPAADPAVRQRRAEVMATGPVAAVEPGTEFMTPSQRRRELHALTEEMELLFAQTRTR